MKSVEELTQIELETRCGKHYAYHTQCTDIPPCIMVEECDGYEPGCKNYEPMIECGLDYEAILIQRLNKMKEMNDRERRQDG